MHGAEIARYFDARLPPPAGVSAPEPQFGPGHPTPTTPGECTVNQDEMIAKLAPAIGLRRHLGPYTDPKFPTHADPVLAVRPLYPSERTCSDETLDTILLEHAIDAKHEHPYGLLAASSSAIALTWFPGLTTTTIRLLATGISALTGRPTTYVQIFAGTEEQIIAAIVAADNADAWSAEDLADTETPLRVRPPNA